MVRNPFRKQLITLLLSAVMIMSVTGGCPVTVYATEPEAGETALESGAGEALPESGDRGTDEEAGTGGSSSGYEGSVSGSDNTSATDNGNATEGEPGDVKETGTEIGTDGTGNDDAEPFEDIVITQEYTEQSDEIMLPDADTLYEQYFNRTMYPMETSPRRKAARYTLLGDDALLVYNELKPFIAAVANGERSDTIFELDYTRSFTAAELGVSSIVVNGAFAPGVTEKVREFVVNQCFRPAMRALMADVPYELYWFDKTLGWGCPYTVAYSNGNAVVKNVRIYMTVSANYSVSGAGGTYEADTTVTGATKTAATQAQGIVDYASVNCSSDYGILRYYLEKVCDLTDYNDEAAYGPGYTPYGDPWQLVWVFDNDPDTKVVCEGYSKAFKYLCDLTVFNSSNVEAYLTTGDMSRNLNGYGPHMWNTVRMDDGAYYLVDATNCDQTVLTYDLFLKGYQIKTTGSGGFPAYGYARNPGPYYSYTLYYMLDEDTAGLFTDEEMSLSSEDYVPGLRVMLDARGGSVTTDSLRVMPGETYGDLPVPARTGYDFIGWYTEETGGMQVTAETAVTAVTDHTLYAGWTPQTYTVTFDAGGGSTVPESATVMYDAEYGELSVPVRTGYKFTGWYTEETGGTRVTSETVVSATEDHTLYAHWEERFYTVFFNLNGGRFPTRTTHSEPVQEGAFIARPEDPVRTKHAFLGWFTKPATDPDAEEYNRFAGEPTGEGVTQNLTLYAHWSALDAVSAPEIRLFSDHLNDPDNVVINHSVTGTGGSATQSGVALWVGTGARIRLTSETPDATIYYKLYPTVEEAYADTAKFNDLLAPVSEDGDVHLTDPRLRRYTEEIVLTPDTVFDQPGEAYKTVTLWAIAVKADHTNSGYSATTIYVYNEDTEDSEAGVTPDWGDVTEEDRNLFSKPSDVPKEIWIAGVKNAVYTGTAVTLPSLRVYHNKTLLKIKTDYTVSYKNNVNVAASDATNTKGASIAPTVVVTGRGNYSGAYLKTFSITPLDLNEQKKEGRLAAPDIELKYNGKVQKGSTALTFTYGEKTYTLKKGRDYTIGHAADDVTGVAKDGVTVITGADLLKAPGDYTIKIKGDGKNCVGEITFRQTITEKTFLGSVTVPAIPAQRFVYAGKTDAEGNPLPDGKAFVYAPEGSEAAAAFDVNTQMKLLAANGDPFVLNLTDRNKADPVTNKKPYILKYGEDYEVVSGSYVANNTVGTASFTIRGAGDYYTGTRTLTFKINGTAALSAVSFDGKASTKYAPASAPYTGVPVIGKAELTYKGETLAEGRDYTVEHLDNTNAGIATVLYTGRGAFTGSVKKTFKITAYDLAKDTDGRISAELDPREVPYEKNGAKPAKIKLTYKFIYKDENDEDQSVEYTLTPGTDYTLSWKNNTTVRDAGAKNPPVIVMTGKGNFTGKHQETFTITPQLISKCTVTAPDAVYTGKAGKSMSAPVVTDVNGAVLKAGTDYDKNKTAWYYGEDTVLANGEIRKEGEAVRTGDIVPAGTVLRVVVSGKGNYTGTAWGTYRVVNGDLSKASVKIDTQYYTGREIRLTKRDLVVTVPGRVLSDSDYEIVSYKNNIKKGKASVTLRGTGYYGKEKTVTFSIVDRPVSFVIRFDSNRATGGTMKQKTANPGTIVTLTGNAFKRTYYTFEGWNTKPDGSGDSYGDKQVFTVPDNAAGTVLTLYAQWKPVEYRVIWHLQGGVNHPDNETRTAYSADTQTFAVKVPEQDTWPAGFQFGGWYADINYKTKITQVRRGSGGDLHIYAKWMPYTYQVNFDGNGATSGSMKQQIFSYGAVQALPANSFKRTGYTFAGWAFSAEPVNAEVVYTNKEAVRNLIPSRSDYNGKVTLYAVWRNTPAVSSQSAGTTAVIPEEAFAIIYKNLPAGAFNDNPAYYYTQDDTVELKDAELIGNVFLGWYSDAKFSKRVTQIVKGNKGNRTLYAKWRVDAYVIDYVTNGGAIKQDASGYLNSNTRVDTASYALPVPEKEGFIFAGWFSDKNLRTRVTQIDARTGINITLYAKWTAEVADNKKDIANAEITIATQKYTGNPVTLKKSDVFIRFGDGPFLDDASFEIVETSYFRNTEDNAGVSENNTALQARVTIRGAGAYTGTQMAYFRIDKNAKTYRLCYDSNIKYVSERFSGMIGPENVGGSMKDEVLVEGARLQKKAYTLPHSSFTGWNTKPDGSGCMFADGETVDARDGSAIAKDPAGEDETDSDGNPVIRLYAQWNTELYRSELTNEILPLSLRDQRPIAVMIDNEQVALPHYGMSEADVVYEMMNSTANNRVTRYMAIYKNWKNVSRIGNVRSTRPTNALLFPEWNAVLFHEGAPYVHTNAYFKNNYTPHIDGGFSRIPRPGKAYEFTSFLTAGQAASRMKNAGISEHYDGGFMTGKENRNHFRFNTDGSAVDLSGKYRGVVNGTTVDLSTAFPKNHPNLKYNASKGVYEYTEYGSLHRDAEDSVVLSFKNVILQKTPYQQLDSNGYLVYNALQAFDFNDPATYTEGWYITNGKAVKVIWWKVLATEPTKYFALNSAGNYEEITVDTGKTYIALVPDDYWGKVRVY